MKNLNNFRLIENITAVFAMAINKSGFFIFKKNKIFVNFFRLNLIKNYYEWIFIG